MSGRTSSVMLLRNGLLAGIMAWGLLGCGSDAPVTYHVSGMVNFDGKPIPKGQIYFMPDGSKNNKGVAGFAQITDGKFDTKLDGGKGHASGPMIVRIEGSDPAAKADPGSGDTSGEEVAKALFPSYETTADLPKEDSTQNFDVPAAAAKKKVRSESDKQPSGGV